MLVNFDLRRKCPRFLTNLRKLSPNFFQSVSSNFGQNLACTLLNYRNWNPVHAHDLRFYSFLPFFELKYHQKMENWMPYYTYTKLMQFVLREKFITPMSCMVICNNNLSFIPNSTYDFNNNLPNILIWINWEKLTFNNFSSFTYYFKTNIQFIFISHDKIIFSFWLT